MNIEMKILDEMLYMDVHNHPKYETQASIGIDLRITKDIILVGHATALIGTGIAINIKDPNVGAFIYPRSGLGHKEGLILGNSTGVIDSDYQGELKLSLYNRSDVTRYYSRGDRVAQLVFQPIIKAVLIPVKEFSDKTIRGSNGFGSSGVI